MELDDRIIASAQIGEDTLQENSIRPRVLDEYIGQEREKAKLKIIF